MKVEVKKADLVFAGIVWLVLSLSFVFNFFGVGLNPGWFEDFQKDSSVIVEKTAICKGQLHYGGPVIPGAGLDYMKTMSSDDCTPANYVPYDSQFGLQARAIAFFAPSKDHHIRTYFHSVETALAILTALLLAAITLRIKRLFGVVSAGVTAALLALSVWITGYAHNLYWVEPLMIAPFAVAFVAYPWLRRTGRLWLLYGIEAVLLFAKSLDGYEHITTIALSILVPVVFYELMSPGRRITDLWKQAAVAAGITVLAFVGAVACNVAALTQYYGSPREAIQHIQRRSAARSLAGIKDTKKDVILNFAATAPLAYQAVDRVMDLDALKDGHGATVKYVGVSALNYLLLPAITLPVPINGLFGTVLQSILFWSVLGYVAIRKLRGTAGYRALHWAYWVSLAGALSWLILMPGHAFPHAHLNGIIFYLPHLLFCYLAIGLVIAEYAAGRRLARGRK